MQPARLSSGWISRVGPSSRNLVVVCAATIGGIVIGGVSVLGVAIAVIQPPTHDAPAGSAVFDGQPHVVQQAPAASSAPSIALQANLVTPVEAQAMSQPQPQPQPRASRNPRDLQLVIRHRQDSDDDNQEAVNSNPPPQYDSWNNFFGYSRNDNWHN
jgi:hypothetical protein